MKKKKRVFFAARLISHFLHLECRGFNLSIDSVLSTVIGQLSLALRRHYDPAMFEPENLARILCPEKYEYVLDR